MELYLNILYFNSYGRGSWDSQQHTEIWQEIYLPDTMVSTYETYSCKTGTNGPTEHGRTIESLHLTVKRNTDTQYPTMLR